ncbi:hypothetical protein BJ878DRAFT_532224 [Calycina marina]|uniref:Heavy metal tolerance protein n=1 Tax=Calycina marina TaxID=1763456 RepID=A0A9P7Z9W1_9HELO|nr:hypothetical protein BJ878DRAFT_532224 [Calycina marina]
MPLPLSSQDLLVAIYYGTPIACFVYFGLAFSFTVCTLQTQDSGMNRQRGRRGLMITLILALAATYFYLLACTAIFTAQSLALYDTESPAWYPYYPTWFLGLVAEITLFVLSDTWKYPSSMFELVCIIIQSLRAGAFVALPMICLGLRGNISRPYDNADAERQALLSKRLASNTASSDENGYGSIETEDSDTADNTSEAGSEDSWIAREQQSKDAIAKRLKENGNWFTYLNGFMIFLPYVWPYQSKRLQIRALLVGGCLLASNALHVLVPRQMGKMVDSVDAYIKHQPGSSDSVPNVWLPVLGYALLIFVSGGACLGWLRRWLWLPVEQYSYDAISTASHAHLMNLSSDFHDSKTSSDLTQAISGGRSVPNLLETVCFEVVPMFIDLAVAFAFLSTIFGPLMGLILVVEAVIYFYVTTKLIAFRAGKRREYIAIYRKEWNVAQQSLDGWSTASLFNQIKHEEDRYSLAVKEHMASQVSYEMSTQALGAVQGAIMTLGLIGALFLGVWQVSRQGRSIGNLTTLLAYWAQLQSPLQFFSTILRTISYSLMDAERLLELFQTKPTVIDRPNAAPLNLTHGEVEFTNVSFAYDKRKPTLKEVSFSIPAGKTVALVGETGGGKTTILKMIDRFYDVKSGSIKIDDQDIRDVTLQSLRAKIGVVPQDPMLFNDSIMSNLRYARLDATDEEVFEACKAAAVHDKIMSFPDGYSAKVGDRGVKLSGGEKQRVAIARAILKKPELILLDEATSAVDTETEVQIQDGLKVLCRNRTTFIVAHRLSTVMRADRILVVMNGEIVENGSHDELLHKDGKYASLWSKQISVKPNDSRSRSKSPKRDGDLINDLSMTQQTTTLSKWRRK